MSSTPRLQLVARTGHPSFLDLPWDRPLEEWTTDRLVDVQRGISRHVVRFVEYDGALYALKELPAPLACRTLFARGGVEDLRHRLLDAGAELLVRLHLAGFFWGDCSLSNTLFRRDAGLLQAYIIDVETSERYPQLSEGQRQMD